MTRRCRRLLILLVSLGLTLFACTADRESETPGAVGPQHPEESDGGILRVAVASDPRSWNRLLAVDGVTHVVTDQLHEGLVRLNPLTQSIEPAVAESWWFTEGGEELRFRLREGVRFGDGEPVTASDVVFTFQVLHDAAVGSQLAATAHVDGAPLMPEAMDERIVRFALPRRTAALERVFDSIAILPEHVLRGSWEAGDLVRDTAPGGAVSKAVGLGPFTLESHAPGERVVLRRNPYYWRAAASKERRPKLDGMVFEVISDVTARVMRLRSGGVDLVGGLPPGAFRSLEKVPSAEVALLDGGPGLSSERLWFNLNPASPIEVRKKTWFQDVRFRRAVSLAIDRGAIAGTVFRGLATPATGSVSPANRFWQNPSLPPPRLDPEESRRLLREAGFRLEGDDLVDETGRKVDVTILTSAGNRLRERTGASIQEDLRRIGIAVRTVPIEGGSLLERLTVSFDYEAALLGISSTDPDPSAEMAFWMSEAPLHLWHPRQRTPATEWEARIDELMRAQSYALDAEVRRTKFHEVQRIASRMLPVLDLVVPHELLAASTRVRNLRPNPFQHALWNSDELSIEPR